MRESPRSGPTLGVVIPTLDEEAFLPALLDDLARLDLSHRVVVADGGSSDATRELARRRGAQVVRAPRGRAHQMNVGAAALSTPWLLFVHADSRVPGETARALARWLADPPPERAAHFAFRLDALGFRWRLLERGQRLRERLTGMAYGDQGLLISRQRWVAMGGIPSLSIMEDVEAVRRLHRSGGVSRIEAPIITSPRRYQEEGFVRGWLRNAVMATLYRAGVPTQRLAPWYRPRGRPRGRERGAATADSGRPPVVLVFARAPQPGQVKTRLAAGVGVDRATRLYRAMGKGLVDALRAGARPLPYRIVVRFTPAHARDEVEAWLGSEDLAFLPQVGHDLGARMSHAFDAAFHEADRVVIVGTDIPELDRSRIEEALALLDRGGGADEDGGPNGSANGGADAVFGPALDGGYYLLALRRRTPSLFRNVPWSTPEVLEASLARACEAGLRVRTLDVLADVDRADDLRPGLVPAAIAGDGVQEQLRTP